MSSWFDVSLDRIRCGVDATVFDVNAQEHGYREPHHDDEKEKGVADVACAVRDETDDQRTDERARLVPPSAFRQEYKKKGTLSVMENRPYLQISISNTRE